MAVIDWIIFSVYMAGIAALGLSFSPRQSRPNEFFLAGRKMGWLPIGLSVMVTAFSAINYTAFPGEVFEYGLYVTLSLPVFIIVAWPITRVIMPFYHSMQLCSAYEYLERRFDVRVRSAASGLFILWRVVWMAVALYASCQVLAAITGLSLVSLILITGGVTTVFTMAGGMRAVMWTDVAHFFVLVAGLAVAVITASAAQPDGFVGMLRCGINDGLARPFYPYRSDMFSFDPATRISIWSALIGTFVAFLARYGADQVIVQRYFTAKTLRDARRGFHLNYVGALTALILLALLGFAMHAYAVQAGTLGPGGKPAGKPIHYLVQFITSLPAGVSGLIVAGLLAATMSTIEAGIHSCSAAFMTDFYRRFAGKSADDPAGRRNLRLSRLLTVAFGAGSILLAFYVQTLGTIFEIANKVINGLGSPLLAVLLLGMFSRRVNSQGMLIGAVAGTAWSIACPFFITSLSLHYFAVVNFAVTLAACAAASAVARSFGHRCTPEQLAWTWSARRRQPQ